MKRNVDLRAGREIGTERFQNRSNDATLTENEAVSGYMGEV